MAPRTPRAVRVVVVEPSPAPSGESIAAILRALDVATFADAVTYLPPVRAVQILHAATERLAAPNQFGIEDHVDLGLARGTLRLAATQLGRVCHRGGPKR